MIKRVVMPGRRRHVSKGARRGQSESKKRKERWSYQRNEASVLLQNRESRLRKKKGCTTRKLSFSTCPHLIRFAVYPRQCRLKVPQLLCSCGVGTLFPTSINWMPCFKCMSLLFFLFMFPLFFNELSTSFFCFFSLQNLENKEQMKYQNGFIQIPALSLASSYSIFPQINVFI